MPASRIPLLITFTFLFHLRVLGQVMDVDVAEVTNLVKRWNAAHTVGKVDNLSSLYADEVLIYGSEVTRAECVSKKELMFRKEGLHQSVRDDLSLSAYSDGAIRCDFITVVTRGKKITENDCYLILREINGEYQITEESDLATDRRLGNFPNVGAKVNIRNAPMAGSGDSRLRTWRLVVDIVLIIATIGLVVLALLFVLRKWAEIRGGRHFRFSVSAGSRTAKSQWQGASLRGSVMH